MFESNIFIHSGICDCLLWSMTFDVIVCPQGFYILSYLAQKWISHSICHLNLLFSKPPTFSVRQKVFEESWIIHVAPTQYSCTIEMYFSYHFETQYWSLDNISKLFIKENALKENAVHGTERRVHNATKQTNSHANALRRLCYACLSYC